MRYLLRRARQTWWVGPLVCWISTLVEFVMTVISVHRPVAFVILNICLALCAFGALGVTASAWREHKRGAL